MSPNWLRARRPRLQPRRVPSVFLIAARRWRPWDHLRGDRTLPAPAPAEDLGRRRAPARGTRTRARGRPRPRSSRRALWRPADTEHPSEVGVVDDARRVTHAL